jgi:hypothetical protein
MSIVRFEVTAVQGGTAGKDSGSFKLIPHSADPSGPTAEVTNGFELEGVWLRV